MSKRKKRKRMREKKRYEQKKKREEAEKQNLPPEFNEIADDIVAKLVNPADDLTEGFIVEYETDDLRPLARMLRQKLPFKPPTIKRIKDEPVSVKIPESNILIWHGTSLSRADAILELGFIAGRKKGGVYFSSNIMTSMRYAQNASAGHSTPAIFAAIYDLSKLKQDKEFGVQNHVVEAHYVFRPAVATRIVKYLLTCSGLYYIGKIALPLATRIDARFKDNLTEIAITQSSGNTGIAYWLNSFLCLDDSDCIPENHPNVAKIKAWVDEQYEKGRMAPITDEEILILAKEHLLEYFQEIFKPES